MKLKTGVTSNIYSERVHHFFEKNNVETEVVVLAEAQDYAGALRRGDVQAVAIPLNETPFFEQTDLVIAALTDRNTPGYCLFVRDESYDPAQVLKIKKGGRISTDSALLRALLGEIRPDFEFLPAGFTLDDSSGMIRADAICGMNDASARAFEAELFKKIPLSPFEFPPQPGSGVFAIVCLREDMDSRRQLKVAHRSEVSVCTNVERSLVRENHDYREKTGVFCERDANGYYHAYAVFAAGNEIHRARISSSTHAGLAGELGRKLFSQGVSSQPPSSDS